MPCWTQQINRVSLTDVRDARALALAIERQFPEAKASVSGSLEIVTFRVQGEQVTWARGELSSAHSPARLKVIAEQVQQAYAKQIVRTAAKRYGFTVQEGAGEEWTLTRADVS